MGIKLGSVIEVIDSETDEVLPDIYTITRVDPDDLGVPFLGHGEKHDMELWFTPRGEVFNFESETDAIVVKE